MRPPGFDHSTIASLGGAGADGAVAGVVEIYTENNNSLKLGNFSSYLDS